MRAAPHTVTGAGSPLHNAQHAHLAQRHPVRAQQHVRRRDRSIVVCHHTAPGAHQQAHLKAMNAHMMRHAASVSASNSSGTSSMPHSTGSAPASLGPPTRRHRTIRYVQAARAVSAACAMQARSHASMGVRAGETPVVDGGRAGGGCAGCSSMHGAAGVAVMGAAGMHGGHAITACAALPPLPITALQPAAPSGCSLFSLSCDTTGRATVSHLSSTCSSDARQTSVDILRVQIALSLSNSDRRPRW